MDPHAGRLRRLLHRLEFGLLELAFAALVAMNTVNVFARYVLQRSIGSLFEIMVLLAIAAYWLGVATAERSQSHLGMNFVTARLTGGWRSAALWLRAAVITAFLLAAAWSAGLAVVSQWRTGARAGSLGLPLWPFTLFIPLGCLLMLWRALGHAELTRSAVAPAGAPEQRS